MAVWRSGEKEVSLWQDVVDADAAGHFARNAMFVFDNGEAIFSEEGVQAILGAFTKSGGSLLALHILRDCSHKQIEPFFRQILELAIASDGRVVLARQAIAQRQAAPDC